MAPQGTMHNHASLQAALLEASNVSWDIKIMQPQALASMTGPYAAVQQRVLRICWVTIW